VSSRLLFVRSPFLWKKKSKKDSRVFDLYWSRIFGSGFKSRMDKTKIRPLVIPWKTSALQFDRNFENRFFYRRFKSKYIGQEQSASFLRKIGRERSTFFWLYLKPREGFKFSRNKVGSLGILDFGFNFAVQLAKRPDKWMHIRRIIRKHKNRQSKKNTKRYKFPMLFFFLESRVYNYAAPFFAVLQEVFLMSGEELFFYYKRMKTLFSFFLSNVFIFFIFFNNRLDMFLLRIFPLIGLLKIRELVLEGYFFINGVLIRDCEYLIEVFDFISYRYLYSMFTVEKESSFFFFIVILFCGIVFYL